MQASNVATRKESAMSLFAIRKNLRHSLIRYAAAGLLPIRLAYAPAFCATDIRDRGYIR
jgi:hypothetical protein